MLTKEIADIVVKETIKRLGYNINIFDHNGIVLSSGDKSREDTFHEGALQVVSSGKPLYITDSNVIEYRGAKPGINFPIYDQNQLIGVVGISGEPEKIKDFGALVVLMTELLIRQQLLSNEVEWKFRTSEAILDELMSDHLNHSKISQKLSVLHVNLSAPFYPMAFSVMNEDQDDTPLLSYLYKDLEAILKPFSCIYAYVDATTFLLLIYSKSINEIARIESTVERYMLTQFGNVRMARGYVLEHLEQVRDVMKQLRLVLNQTKENKINIRDYEIQLLLNEVDEDKRKVVKNRIQKQLTPEQLQTLNMFFSHNLNVNATASAMFIHRNTLLYRLNKIYEITGYNPRNFYDSMILKISDWL
ncbi:CdaR family transcriptional regulator [Bacillus timonensis]|nr:sugar diacid recognition domain-containing protein [Bacillus timonensis]